MAGAWIHDGWFCLVAGPQGWGRALRETLRAKSRAIHQDVTEGLSCGRSTFVIATIGFGGWEMSGPHKIVADAQLAVSRPQSKYPQLGSKVLTVEICDFWCFPEVSPKDQGFHYNQNAETYMLVGEALGNGMLQLLKDDATRP